MKKKEKEKNNQFIDSHGVASDVGESQISKYHSGKNGKAGHGFAAEDANALVDKFKGKRVEKVGTNNAKNGPDRVSSGEKIQTKYCKTARETVNAAFEGHRYKYRLRNGRPMKLEVPYDQYEDAIQYMKEKIIKGEVTGVKKPEHAYKMIKRGVKYDHAVAIAKTGKAEGLLYDAANGAVTCIISGGISAAITFIRDKQKGVKTSKALKHAGGQALKSTGATAITQVAVSQTERLILSQASKSASKKAVEEGSKRVSTSLLTNLAKSSARTNVITGVVTTVVTSVPDINRARKGKMKWSECGENVAVNAGSVAAGMKCGIIGAKAGTAIAPGIGTFVGGLAGSIVGSVAASAAGKKAISAVKSLFGKK